MRLLLLIPILLLAACGKGGSGSAASGGSPAPGPVTPGVTPVPTHVYRMEVTGDLVSVNSGFTLNQGQGDEISAGWNNGTVMIAVGQTLIWASTGRNMRAAAIYRHGTTATGLVGKVYRDNVLKETSMPLFSDGEHWNFVDLD